jgi:hypothetical protein
VCEGKDRGIPNKIGIFSRTKEKNKKRRKIKICSSSIAQIRDEIQERRAILIGDVVNSVSKPAREPLLLASWMRKALRTLVIINGAFAGWPVGEAGTPRCDCQARSRHALVSKRGDQRSVGFGRLLFHSVHPPAYDRSHSYIAEPELILCAPRSKLGHHRGEACTCRMKASLSYW